MREKRTMTFDELEEQQKQHTADLIEKEEVNAVMIDREKVVNDLQDAVNDDWLWRHADYYALTMERAIALLKEQPEIIRCKDCKHRYKGWCCAKYHVLEEVEADFFCADGERKD